MRLQRNSMPNNEREIKVIKKANRQPAPPHPFYNTFCDAKSVAIEIARIIAQTDDKNMPSDVRRFIEEFGQKAV